MQNNKLEKCSNGIKLEINSPNSKKNNFGKKTYENGDIYEGHFRNGLRHG